MAVHIILLALGLAIEVYIFKTALYAVGQYEDVYNEMVADPAVMPDYVIYEGFIADKFNRFFFGASSECQKEIEERGCVMPSMSCSSDQICFDRPARS
eukprot:scaffold487_cov178-Ochromonas_danica.AAC.32